MNIVLICHSILTLLALNLGKMPQSANNADNLTTVADLWSQHPDRMRSLFGFMGALDLRAPGLSEVNTALQQGDTIQAGELLVDYYREVDRTWVISTLDPMPENESMDMANLLLQDSIRIGLDQDKIPLNKTGGWEWSYTGPHQDDEFGYSLNGHKYLPALFRAWEYSQNPRLMSLNMMQSLRIGSYNIPLPSTGDSIYLSSARKRDWTIETWVR